MNELDRDRVIELLERLGAEDDAEALAAARELHRLVSEAGLDWDDLLEPEPGEEDEEEFEEDEAAEVEAEEDAEEEAEAASAAADDAAPVAANFEADAELIDRLLARKGVSAETRSELAELKQDMAAGEFTAMDSRYVRALAKRLGA